MNINNISIINNHYNIIERLSKHAGPQWPDQIVISAILMGFLLRSTNHLFIIGDITNNDDNSSLFPHDLLMLGDLLGCLVPVQPRHLVVHED
mgnify:CR=1 FL=1